MLDNSSAASGPASGVEAPPQAHPPAPWPATAGTVPAAAVGIFQAVRRGGGRGGVEEEEEGAERQGQGGGGLEIASQVLKPMTKYKADIGCKASLLPPATHVPRSGDGESLRSFARQLWTLLDDLADGDPEQYKQFLLGTAQAAGADAGQVEHHIRQEATKQWGPAASGQGAGQQDIDTTASSMPAAAAAPAAREAGSGGGGSVSQRPPSRRLPTHASRGGALPQSSVAIAAVEGIAGALGSGAADASGTSAAPPTPTAPPAGTAEAVPQVRSCPRQRQPTISDGNYGSSFYPPLLPSSQQQQQQGQQQPKQQQQQGFTSSVACVTGADGRAQVSVEVRLPPALLLARGAAVATVVLGGQRLLVRVSSGDSGDTTSSGDTASSGESRDSENAGRRGDGSDVIHAAGAIGDGERARDDDEENEEEAEEGTGVQQRRMVVELPCAVTGEGAQATVNRSAGWVRVLLPAVLSERSANAQQQPQQ